MITEHNVDDFKFSIKPFNSNIITQKGKKKNVYSELYFSTSEITYKKYEYGKFLIISTNNIYSKICFLEFFQYTIDVDILFKDSVVTVVNGFCNENRVRPQDCGVSQ